MKLTAWALTVFTLVLLSQEQATFGSSIEGEIYTREGRYYTYLLSWSGTSQPIYAGDYNIKLLVGDDTIGCTVRVGTKSSNTNLLTISGPLAVRNVTDPLEFFVRIGKAILTRTFTQVPFQCGTTGTIRVSDPPTVAVPVMVTLTYGPFLKQTYNFVVTQKAGIKSVAASPVRSYYSYNQRVGMTLTPTRKKTRGESSPRVYVRVREGKLCKITDRYDLSRYYGDNSYEPSEGWQYLPGMSAFFMEGKPITRWANLCHRGRTIVEFGFPDEKITDGKDRMMTDSRILRLEFRVPTRRTTKKSRIQSRGIDSQPPLIIPDPEPPALPNFELQGEKP
jgi:hypothetical protein